MELTAHRPNVVLEVWAIHPEVGSRESVVVRTIVGTHKRGWGIGTRTDAMGLARVPYFGELATVSTSFSARGDDGWVFGPLDLGPPLTKGPHELVATRGADLEVLVVSKTGSPLIRARVELKSEIDGVSIREHLETGDDGKVVFEGLFEGSYEVFAVWNGRHTKVTLTVDGERNTSTIVIDVVGEIVLLASGQVVDGNGAPLEGVNINGTYRLVRTDASGRFEVRGDAGQLVLLLAPYRPNARFEPSSLEVAAGTSDLVFRRVALEAQAGWWVEVVEAQSGAVLGDAELYAWTEPDDAERWTDYHRQWYWSGEDAEELFTGPQDPYHWLVAHPGYRSLFGTGAEFRAREASDPVRGGKRIRFELELGILREVFVFDQEGEPVPGAVFSDSVGVLGTTDIEGFVLVDAPRWPDRVDVECRGFQPERWFPGDDLGDWEPAWVELERVRER